MANAFECDGCNELKRGSPSKFRLKQYDEVQFISDGKTRFRMELCTSCKSEMRSFMKNLLDEE